MEAKKLRDLLSKRLYIELQLFRDLKLRQEKEDIYKSSYVIEVYVNLYDIIMEHLDSLQKDIIRGLLNLKSGILEFLYQEWLTREDSFYDELRSYAWGELENISRQDCRKDSDE